MSYAAGDRHSYAGLGTLLPRRRDEHSPFKTAIKPEVHCRCREHARGSADIRWRISAEYFVTMPRPALALIA